MEPHDEAEYMYMMQAEAYKHSLEHAESARGYAEAHYNSQIIDELANLEAGMDSVKRNVDYYQHIYDNLKQSYNQLKSMVGPVFKEVKIPVSSSTYHSELTTPYVLLEKAIVEAYRKSAHYSAEEFIIMCNPDTFRQIAEEAMSSSFGKAMIHIDDKAKIFYKGMRVFRTYELPPNQFIVK